VQSVESIPFSDGLTSLQGLDELFAQSPAHRLLGPEHAAAIAAAAEQQASRFEQRAGRRDPQSGAASGGAELATPEVHRHGGQRGEALPLPTARKLVSLHSCINCRHTLASRVCSRLISAANSMSEETSMISTRFCSVYDDGASSCINSTVVAHPSAALLCL
jgi:hypothetical protein